MAETKRKMMNLDPEKTYKVTHTITYRGRNEGTCRTDLQCDEGLWYLVFEWTTNHDGEYPSLRHPVDVRDLRALVPGEFLLEFPVILPESQSATEALERMKGG